MLHVLVQAVLFQQSVSHDLPLRTADAQTHRVVAGTPAHVEPLAVMGIPARYDVLLFERAVLVHGQAVAIAGALQHDAARDEQVAVDASLLLVIEDALVPVIPDQAADQNELLHRYEGQLPQERVEALQPQNNLLRLGRKEDFIDQLRGLLGFSRRQVRQVGLGRHPPMHFSAFAPMLRSALLFRNDVFIVAGLH